VERLDVNRYVVCHDHNVCLLDVVNKTFSVLQKSRKGFSNPLNLSSDGINVYWGDYGNNASHESVNIYRLTPKLNVDVVYTFPKGIIRHIHNIIWDEKHQFFYVMTGDMEATSGIYIASSDWSMVKPVAIGSQQYRAVVAFPYKNGLIYATDSVEDSNHIYLLQDEEVKPLHLFPGSCIYGTEIKDFFVFSSTVEPPEGRGLMSLLTNRLGTGIQDRYVHLIIISKNDLTLEEILKVKKDIWPMKLFQYGSIMFPKGQKMCEGLWYYSIACKGDGKSFKLVF
jgi:hypothetical protein